MTTMSRAHEAHTEIVAYRELHIRACALIGKARPKRARKNITTSHALGLFRARLYASYLLGRHIYQVGVPMTFSWWRMTKPKVL
jgi:hypothetical protein